MIKSSELQLWNVYGSGYIQKKMVSNTLENIFPNLTGVQNRDQTVLTYVLAWWNTHPSLALTSARIYFRTYAAGGTNLAIALDTTGPAPANGVIWNFSNPPATYITPTTVGTGLSVPTLNPGYAVAFWIRRTATASAPLRPERNTITITGTSAA